MGVCPGHSGKDFDTLVGPGQEQLLIVAALPPIRQPEFSGLVYAFFLLLEDQPADLEVQLLGVGEVIDVAQRLILSR